MFLDVEEITEQEMANNADDEDNDVELEVAVVIESSEQEEENAESECRQIRKRNGEFGNKSQRRSRSKSSRGLRH
ncbi:hypothetical protein G6F65_022425 [Rhizopus arrhizus]|nr:hypothetical protein G6F65_022425 [Rhizopus arrhizus]